MRQLKTTTEKNGIYVLATYSLINVQRGECLMQFLSGNDLHTRQIITLYYDKKWRVLFMKKWKK